MSVSVQQRRRLEAAEVERLDPYAFMAVIGKRIIHPGGRAATEQLLKRAGISADTNVLEIDEGPFEMMTPKGFIRDEGVARSLGVMRRVMARPAYIKKMTWLMPRVRRAVPYLGT